MNNKTYVETQSFWSRWFTIIFLILAGLLVYNFAVAEKWRWDQFIVLLIPGTLLIYFVYVRLYTILDSTGIYVDFKPFLRRKKWSWDEVQHIQIIKYGFLDYGGWGYRDGTYGKGYTVQGYYGFQIHFKDGSKVLIGTQRPEEVQQFLDQIKHEQL